MPLVVRYHRPLVVLALAGFVVVAVAFFRFEQPGLGIGHLFYLPVALLALTTTALAGAVVGLLAAAIWAGLLVITPQLPSFSELLGLGTSIRAVTFVATGALIGWVASTKRELLDQLRVSAERDHLTGLLNARAFEESFTGRCAEARPFALLLADVDGLKQVNDRDGHLAGNVLLRRVAEALAEELRAEDELARVGGDEFAALLPGLPNPVDAEATARRLERRLERRGLWISVGSCAYPAEAESPLALYRRADARLYESKERRGRSPRLGSVDGAGVGAPSPPAGRASLGLVSG